jgi:two-component system OmpR family response regulator
LEGKRILVADHDEHIVSALVHLLSDAGAAVETAYDGVAASEKAEELDPDLVILGATLPKRSGYLVLEQLKRPTREDGRAPFVIMITHIRGKRHQLWAEGTGADGYFHKPFRMDHFLDRVKELLSK